MMVYLNDKDYFNLKDIMERYGVSKSTALRDIKSLELIGMPIYSEIGRNGYYGVLQNRILSPIVFNIDEVFALYFSMITLRAYETTPFHLCVEKLKEKFESCLSPEKIGILRKTEKVLSFCSIEQYNHCEFLKDILQSAIEEKVCEVNYLKQDIKRTYFIQFFDVSTSFGQWYATGYNFETDRTQVFRCDKVLDIHGSSNYQPKTLIGLKKDTDKIFKTSTATEFEVMISTKGVDLFQKEHYPSMRLELEDGRYFIRGFYNKGEEKFISSYFIAYGEAIKAIKPIKLATLIREQVESLQLHFLTI